MKKGHEPPESIRPSLGGAERFEALFEHARRDAFTPDEAERLWQSVVSAGPGAGDAGPESARGPGMEFGCGSENRRGVGARGSSPRGGLRGQERRSARARGDAEWHFAGRAEDRRAAERGRASERLVGRPAACGRGREARDPVGEEPLRAFRASTGAARRGGRILLGGAGVRPGRAGTCPRRVRLGRASTERGGSSSAGPPAAAVGSAVGSRAHRRGRATLSRRRARARAGGPCHRGARAARRAGERARPVRGLPDGVPTVASSLAPRIPHRPLGADGP